jgi:hypothetical protein
MRGCGPSQGITHPTLGLKKRREGCLDARRKTHRASASIHGRGTRNKVNPGRASRRRGRATAPSRRRCPDREEVVARLDGEAPAWEDVA